MNVVGYEAVKSLVACWKSADCPFYKGGDIFFKRKSTPAPTAQAPSEAPSIRPCSSALPRKGSCCKDLHEGTMVFSTVPVGREFCVALHDLKADSWLSHEIAHFGSVEPGGRSA